MTEEEMLECLKTVVRALIRNEIQMSAIQMALAEKKLVLGSDVTRFVPMLEEAAKPALDLLETDNNADTLLEFLRNYKGPIH